MAQDREETSPEPTTGHVSRRGLLAVSLGALVVAAALLQFAFLAQAASRDNLAVDLKQAYVPAAQAILDGETPYPDLSDQELGRGDAYVYPPLVAFATVPLTAVPSPDAIATALGIAAVIAALMLVGLRDWRCYAAGLAWVPLFHGVQTANVTLWLVLGIALTWRVRDSPRDTALAGGLTIAAKLVGWPLAVWLAATRRVHAAVGAVLVALVVTLGLWAILGFSGLTGFWDRLRRLEELEGPNSYTFAALATDLGAADWLVSAVRVAIGAACILGVIVAARRGEDARAFAWAVAAVVASSPIVWLHSFTVLLVPLAVTRPRFSVIWLLPATLWFASGSSNGTTAETAVVLVVMTAVVLATVAGPRRFHLEREARAT